MTDSTEHSDPSAGPNRADGAGPIGQHARTRFSVPAGAAAGFALHSLNDVIAFYENRSNRYRRYAKLTTDLSFTLFAAAAIVFAASSLDVWENLLRIVRDSIPDAWRDWPINRHALFRKATDPAFLLLAMAGLLALFGQNRGIARAFARYRLCWSRLELIRAKLIAEINGVVECSPAGPDRCSRERDVAKAALDAAAEAVTTERAQWAADMLNDFEQTMILSGGRGVPMGNGPNHAG